MPVQLYIESIFKPNFERYQVKFDLWMQCRNALHREGNVEKTMLAQEKASRYYSQMYSVGYFRDNYGSGCLLWLFDLSWESDEITCLIIEGWMSTYHAQKFLALLAERETEFEIGLTRHIGWKGWSKASIENYFRGRYKELKGFLNQAINLNEAIMCSLFTS